VPGIRRQRKPSVSYFRFFGGEDFKEIRVLCGLRGKSRFLRHFDDEVRRHFSYAHGSATVQSPVASGKKSGISLKFGGELIATLDSFGSLKAIYLKKLKLKSSDNNGINLMLLFKLRQNFGIPEKDRTIFVACGKLLFVRRNGNRAHQLWIQGNFFEQLLGGQIIDSECSIDSA
jgi:hypothetical protein